MENKTFIDDQDYSNFSFINRKRLKEEREVMNKQGLEMISRSNKFGGIYYKDKSGKKFSRKAFLSIVEAFRQKEKRAKEIEATLLVTKNQEVVADLQKELINLREQINDLKKQVITKSPISDLSTQKLIIEVEQNPNIDLSKQIESEPEISKEEVSDVKTDEKKVEEIKKENGSSDNKGGLPKWVIPALIVGGIAFYLFRKK